ncbi:MAG: hypothetical protein AAGJ40_13170 [Planctomycetota bacterium]
MKRSVSCFLLALVVVATAQIAKADDSLDGLKCFIMVKRDVKGKKVMEYKGADLYLCCSSCVKRMTKTPEKYEAKANHQLVQTGQFVQMACPVSGEAISDSSPMLKIGLETGEVAVYFSSDEHKAKVASLEAEEQVETVFGKTGFETGKFTLKKEETS